MRTTRYLLLLFTVLSSATLSATHIRAADFSSRKLSPTFFEVTLTVYTDFNTVEHPGNIGGIPISEVEIGLLSGLPGSQVITNEFTVSRTTVEEIEPGKTFKNTFEFDFNFPATNSVFRLAFVGTARNNNINNIPSSASTDIFIEEFFFTDALDDDNSSPQFTQPPLFNGATNRVYTYNAGAVDPDGDSLSYELITVNDPSGTPLPGYIFPDDPSFGAGSSFTVNSTTGQVTWDTPLVPGEYNVAIRINEFRNGARIGYVIRDQQILIEDSDNIPPNLFLPKDTCIVANDVYRERFFTSDDNRNRVSTQILGVLNAEGASFSTINIRPDSTVNNITWTPSCDVIGQFPVFGVANAEDDFPGLPLASSGTWEIKVDGPSPNLLSATNVTNGIELSWDSYDCQKPRSIIEIFRFECDTNNVTRSACLVGVPEDWGALKIGEVGVSETSFVDDGSLGGLTSGIQYFYVIAVKFGSPNFGESYASNLVGSSFGANLPLVTGVSYDKSKNDTIVRVSWEHFSSFDSISFTKPYTYKIRSNGIVLEELTVNVVNEGFLELDTLTFNTNLPLELEFSDSTQSIIGSLAFGIDKLEATGGDESLFLNWQNINSWAYPDSLFTRIYLFSTGGDTTIIDSVRNGTLDYTALNLTNGDTVCAFAEIPGVYCQSNVNLVYRNFTNTSCDLVQDREPPCVPDLDLEIIVCDDPSLGNDLEWRVVDRQFELGRPSCNNLDLASFNLQVKPANENEFIDLASFRSDTLNFIHLAGGQLYCYRIQAVDSTGNASAFSTEVCQDFCGSIIYPNVFTPNGDDINDGLLPMSSFEGLENALLQVFNRWGQLVYSSRDPENEPWLGENKSGSPVSEGVYYIEVTADKSLGSPGKVIYKGWVQLLR